MIEQRISVSQFTELLGLEPATLRFVTFGAGRDSSVSVWIAESEDDMAQTSGIFPQLGKKSPKGKGGKKGC